MESQTVHIRGQYVAFAEIAVQTQRFNQQSVAAQ
jgi:hypothetical protein